MKNYVLDSFWGPIDRAAFNHGLQQALNQLPPVGIFAADNLLTFGRNLSFLDDERFTAAMEKHAHTQTERAAIWRTHVLCWVAKRALRLEGDFVECGCYKGVTARIVADYIDFGCTNRRLFLYDLFEHTDDMSHHAMPEHSPELFTTVRNRFSDLQNVLVIKGRVPDSFAQALPDKIAFLHIDMNSANAEVAALEALFDRVTPGAIIVFDDYGWVAYREQKIAEDNFFRERGYEILELPTGQGLLIV